MKGIITPLYLTIREQLKTLHSLKVFPRLLFVEALHYIRDSLRVNSVYELIG